jgi:hypothetical protein
MEITVNGFTFVLSPSNRVIVKGGGIRGSGIDLGSIDSFTPSSFLGGIKGVPAASNVQDQLQATAANIPEVVAALQTKPKEETAPPATESKPVQEEPLPPAATNSANETESQNETYTGAQDDNTPRETSQSAAASETGSEVTDDMRGGVPTEAPTVNQASAAKTQTASNDTLPGRRVFNPLSQLSSYTYQITWYMVNPDAIASLNNSNYTNINTFLPQGSGGQPQAYVIAQSGGVGDPKYRPPGIYYDYYIDDLQFKTALRIPGGPASGMNFEFKIVEPNSFGLATQLVMAANTLYKNSKILNNRDPKKTPLPLDQHFVLAIRFYGYDENGTVIDATKFSSKDTMGGNPSAVFERYYLIKITEFKFKLDGKATTYNIKAAPVPMSEAYGTKRGLISTQISCKGGNVESVLTGNDGLITQLNKIQEDLVKSNLYKLADKYEIKFEQSSIIPQAKLNNAKQDKSNTVTSPVNSTVDNNPQQAAKAVALSTETNIPITPQPILSAIDKIISQSEYVLSALNQVNTPDSSTGETDPKPPSKELNWYHINPIVEPYGWDELRKDWAYKLTYQVHEYKIPYLRSPYTGSRAEYSGPHKRYEYWFTGQNSEIINYEQTYNGLYYLLFAQISGDNKTISDGNGNAPIAAVGGPPQATDSSGGGIAGGQSAQIQNFLYSPKDQAQFKATILGDPDYLTQSVGMNTLNTNFYKKFSVYGYDGFTINPNGGEVFIEITFKEPVDYNASIDPNTRVVSYNDENGLLGINQSVSFYSPKLFSNQAAESKSLVYMLVTVTSSFSRGRFTQELSGVLIDPGAFFQRRKQSGGQQNGQNPREESQVATQNNQNQRAGDLVVAPQVGSQPPYDESTEHTPSIVNQTNNDDNDNRNENARLLARVPAPDSTREEPPPT